MAGRTRCRCDYRIVIAGFRAGPYWLAGLAVRPFPRVSIGVVEAAREGGPPFFQGGCGDYFARRVTIPQPGTSIGFVTFCSGFSLKSLNQSSRGRSPHRRLARSVLPEAPNRRTIQPCPSSAGFKAVATIPLPEIFNSELLLEEPGP
jgi:hypothetical protein